MRDARVEELEQKNTIVEQGVTSVSVQPQNDKEAILEVLLSIDIPVSAVNVPSFVMDQKSSERKPEAIAKRSVPADREMDIFWMRYIRKRLVMRQRNEGKKLMRKMANQEAPPIFQNPTSTTCNER
ncbi:hypothetical protein RhiirB3_445630 [Rhizophagus irregularis]|nr:hypothetical protein RhiirB3_445630 [Rhizophagus irregularis]